LIQSTFGNIQCRNNLLIKYFLVIVTEYIINLIASQGQGQGQVMIPLQPNVAIHQLAFKNVRLELNKEKESKKYLESVHFSVLHSGKVLLSGVEGEVSSGQVHYLH
jgi:hypothetical protein